MDLRILQSFGRYSAGETVSLTYTEIRAIDASGQAGNMAPVDPAHEDSFAAWTPVLRSHLQGAQRERRRSRWH